MMDQRIVVTAAEFTRQFGQLRQEPGDAPVFVTHHGRETHVLMTRRRFDELAEPTTATIAPLDGTLSDLAEWLPHAVLVLDRQGVVLFANAAAYAMMDQRHGTLIGRPLVEAVPAVRETLLESYLRRTMRSGEPSSADLPSPFRAHAWLQVDVRIAADNIVILTRDISDEVLRDRLADRNRAAADAVRLHRGIGQLVLNVRGHIEAIDQTVCDLLALPVARLTNVPLADLIPASGRVAFREQLDGVLRGQGSASLDLSLMSNAGDVLTLSATLVELRGLYGSEGAIVVLTRA